MKNDNICTYFVLSFMLSFDVIIFHGQQMISFLCYHFPLYIFCVIIYVIIWCYHLLLSFPPFFLFPENVTHSNNCLILQIFLKVTFTFVIKPVTAPWAPPAAENVILAPSRCEPLIPGLAPCFSTWMIFPFLETSFKSKWRNFSHFSNMKAHTFYAIEALT